MIPTIIPSMGMVWQGLISGTEFPQLPKRANGRAGSQLIDGTLVLS